MIVVAGERRDDPATPSGSASEPRRIPALGRQRRAFGGDLYEAPILLLVESDYDASTGVSGTNAAGNPQPHATLVHANRDRGRTEGRRGAGCACGRGLERSRCM